MNSKGDRHYRAYCTPRLPSSIYSLTLQQLSLSYLGFRRPSVLTDITLTKVVLPEFCSPTNANSISSFQNTFLNQSRIRCKNANIIAKSSSKLSTNKIFIDFKTKIRVDLNWSIRKLKWNLRPWKRTKKCEKTDFFTLIVSIWYRFRNLDNCLLQGYIESAEQNRTARFRAVD